MYASIVEVKASTDTITSVALSDVIGISVLRLSVNKVTVLDPLFISTTGSSSVSI